jgi:hypothetical protein
VRRSQVSHVNLRTAWRDGFSLAVRANVAVCDLIPRLRRIAIGCSNGIDRDGSETLRCPEEVEKCGSWSSFRSSFRCS